MEKRCTTVFGGIKLSAGSLMRKEFANFRSFAPFALKIPPESDKQVCTLACVVYFPYGLSGYNIVYYDRLQSSH